MRQIICGSQGHRIYTRARVRSEGSHSSRQRFFDRATSRWSSANRVPMSRDKLLPSARASINMTNQRRSIFQLACSHMHTAGRSQRAAGRTARLADAGGYPHHVSMSLKWQIVARVDCTALHTLSKYISQRLLSAKFVIILASNDIYLRIHKRSPGHSG